MNLPNDEEAEKMVLSCVIKDNKIMDRLIGLTDKSFFQEEHKQLWNTFVEMYNKQEIIELPSINNKISKELLSSLLDTLESITSPEIVFQYYKTLKDKEFLRNGISYGSLIVTKCQKEEEPQEIMSLIDKGQNKLSQQVVSKKPTTLQDNYKNTLIDLKERRGQTKPPMPTGIWDLDIMLWGLHRKELLVLAGRPGEHKTSLLTHILMNLALERHKILFVSIDMNEKDIMKKIISQQWKGKYPYSKLRRNTSTLEDLMKIEDMSGLFEKLTFDIIDNKGYSISELRELTRNKDYDVIAIDYIQQLHYDTKNKNKNTALGEYCNYLKELAKTKNCVVIALSQLNKESIHRKDPRPIENDLRDSGEIQFISDTIIANHWKYKLTQKDEDKNILEIGVLRNRHGNGGWLKVNVLPESFYFTDIPRVQSEDCEEIE